MLRNKYQSEEKPQEFDPFMFVSLSFQKLISL